MTAAQPIIGFIGYGNMARAIAQGLVAAGDVGADRIVACAAHYDALERHAAAIGIRPMRTAQEVAEAADMVIVAVKPHQVESVLAPIASILTTGETCVLSIAGGWTLERYLRVLGDGAHVQCAIPNTPIAVAQGILVTELATTFNADESERFERLFAPIANIERIDTAQMDIAVDIAGCAPAFTAMYLEALADAGVEFGLGRQSAYRLAAKMVEGVGALHLATGTHPGAMKDAVCSPGGTTIKGVASLERTGFRGSVIAAIEAIEGN